MPSKPKCCSDRSNKLRKVNFDRAKAAADAAVREGGRPATAKKASAKKATAKRAKPCRVCGK